MSEDKEKLTVVDGGGKEKTPKQRAKKLTGVQLDSQAKDMRKVKKVNLNIAGTKYYYEIDTVPTTTNQANFSQNVRVLTAYISTEEAFSTLKEEEVSAFMASMVLAELLNVFSTLEVGDTIEEKVNFIAKLNDLNILEEVAENIPEGLQDAIKHAEESISTIVDELVEEASMIQKQIIDLEKLQIEEEEETKGE